MPIITPLLTKLHPHILAIPAETAGNGKDNVFKKKCFKRAIHVVKAVQVNISNANMKLQSMN